MTDTPHSWEVCRVFWGSHGCRLARGHDGSHECDCCTCADHDADPHDEEGSVCVAKPPYYGPDTRFYGEDVATYEPIETE